MSRLTQAAVLRGAIEQIESRGGFTSSMYFKHRGGSWAEPRPGPNVGATCAVGGIEQAIWKLSGEHVDNFRGISPSLAKRQARTHPALPIYAAVMSRVDRLARKLYPEGPDGTTVRTLEEITFRWSDRYARPRVVAVLRAALAEVSRR